MPGPYYDEICNHCGKPIHPPKIQLDTPLSWPGIPHPDCIWVARHLARGFPGHPATNYICLDCNKELETWLSRANAR